MFDIVIIGAGVIGLAIAKAIGNQLAEIIN